MKYLLISTLMWPFMYYTLTAQSLNFNCLTEASYIQEAETTMCPFSEMSQEDMDALPNVTVFINIHYINGSYGNFYPGNSSGDLKDGNYYAGLMINHANNDLDHLIPNPVGLTHKLGEAKINYELFSNPSNSNDLYGGVWYWDKEPISFPYSNVMNVVVYNGSPQEVLNGSACSITGCCTRMTLQGAYYNVWENPIQPRFGHWAFAQLLNHELLHTFGLCHSFYKSNSCVDIDPAAECGCGAGNSSCGNGGSGCCSWNSNSTNMMNYAPSLRSLSLCQWGTAYNNAISKNCPFLKFCETEAEPLIIEVGNQVIWDHLMVINRPIIIMPTASLTITCEARFSSEAYVEVRRGARLTVDGALLTNLCPDGFWPGIQVWGNPGKLQPDPANGIIGMNDAGIVQVINGSTIQHARTAISTGAWALGGAGAWANFGGAVYCENSNFIDNRRGVEFMKYNYPNKSKFINCKFSESGNYVSNSVGVTIWECNDITFTRNTFRFLDIAGIFGIDFGAKIYDHNQFRNLPSGIESYNTLFYKGSLEIGQKNSPPNYFKNNKIHIYCASGNGLDRVNIVNNDLFDATSHGIVFEGDSYYNVEGNRFSNSPIALVSDASGISHNLIHCNQFNTHENGILFVDYNEQTQFLDNCFPSNINTAVALDDGASIRFEQGDNYRVANNCMQSQIDIFAPSNFAPFLYFVRHQPVGIYCDPFDLTCEIPTDNLSDGGSNNYFFQRISTTTSTNCSNLSEDIFISNIDITQARINVLLSKIELNFNPESYELKINYERSKRYLQSLIKYLVRQYVEAGNLDLATQMLNSGDSEFEFNMKLTIELLGDNYQKAINMINGLPNEPQSVFDFKQIQQINIQRLIEKSVFSISESQEMLLYQIASSRSSSRSMAKAILALTKGESFAKVYSPLYENLNLEKRAHLPKNSKLFNIFPNPTNGNFEITFSNKLEELLILEIYNSLGNKMFSKRIHTSESFTMENINFSNGIFFAYLVNPNGKCLDFKRFIICN